MSDFELAFQAICRDPRYQRQLDWGRPRGGHPEGMIRAHIAELERNLEKLRPKLTEDDFWKLRILIHTHDTFKSGAKAGVAVSNPRSHASLARQFLSEFCDDAQLLAIVQSHDVPYSCGATGRSQAWFKRDGYKK